jgi:two-component system response regulator
MNETPPPEILLVEDDPNDLELALRALRRVSGRLNVEVARDGAAALALLLGEPDRAPAAVRRNPAAILLDIKLPGVDGIDVLRRLKSAEATRTLPVVMLSSSREARDVATCYELGANSFVVKPGNAQAYEQVVLELCAYWVNRNQPPVRRTP